MWAAACAVSLLALFTEATAADKRVVVDSAGRKVEVPAKINRVFAAGGPASVFIYAIAPEKLLGWNRPLTSGERAYIPSRYANLPTLGRLTGCGNTSNVEAMLASRPDVILDYGAVNPTYISLAERVQQQTGVPYLLLDGSLSQLRVPLSWQERR
jgi:iron complex transport system substrate-binding protein